MTNPKRVPSEDEESAAFLKAVDEGIAALDKGQAVSYERVRAWLLSWGTRGELSKPK